MTDYAVLIAKLRDASRLSSLFNEAADTLAEAKITIERLISSYPCDTEEIAQARTDEREACAKIADDYQDKLGWTAIASAIRARSRGEG